jgi:hypothetical protein
MNPDQFLLRNYELQVRYLSDHFSRMWMRFNFFLTINSALFGFSFNESYDSNVAYIGCAGILFGILWVYFGGVDNWLVDVYRGHVETGFYAITKWLNVVAERSCDSAAVKYEPVGALSFVGNTKEQRRFVIDDEHPDGCVSPIRMSRWSFRWERASATDLATIFPIIFLLAWLLRLAGESGFDWRTVLDRLC